MKQAEATEELAKRPDDDYEKVRAGTDRVSGRDSTVSPQTAKEPCGCDSPGAECTCQDPVEEKVGDTVRAAPSYVYALGTIEPRFPSLAVEKEFAQATARTNDTAGLPDRATLHKVLSEPQNRYLARQLCWSFTIQGLETYILLPRDPRDLDMLLDALRPEPQPDDVDVVIGLRGPIAPPEMCNGLMVPIVMFDQIYSFDRQSLIDSIPRPEKDPGKKISRAADELLARIMQVTDNAGATDEHRALNYLVLRYSAIYARAAEAFADDFSLTAVDVRPSLLGSTRHIVEVIFSFTQRKSDFTEKYFVRVDVTEEWPFLVTKLSPYYDH